MENFQLATIPFPIDLCCCNQKNYELYYQYIKSAIIKSSDTLATTYKTYYDRMKLFFQYLYKYEGNPYIADQNFLFNFTDVWERYSYFCLQAGNSKVTLNGKRTACLSFFDWCVKKRYITLNPFIYIDKIKITDKDKVRKSYFLNSQEIWKIKYFLNECEYIYKEKDKNDKKLRFKIQDNIIFNLLLDSGARISELHSLRLDQLDLDNMIFEDVRLKEGYIEPLIFFEDTRKLIKQWIEYREKNNIVSDYLLITNYKNKINQMTKETIRASIRKIGLIVGIKDFYPHSVRKTIINITAQTDEQLASNFAHHSDLQVTRRHYIKKKTADSIRNQIDSIRSRIGL